MNFQSKNKSLASLLIAGWLFIFVWITAAWALDQEAMKAIQDRERVLGFTTVPETKTDIQTSPDAYNVSVTVSQNKVTELSDSVSQSSSPISPISQLRTEELTIAANYNRKSPTVDKKVTVKYPGMSTYFHIMLDSTGLPGFLPAGSASKVFTNDVVDLENRSWIVYDNGTDVIAYNQSAEKDFSVDMKEWIYARSPNSVQGSRYNWSLSSTESLARLSQMEGGRVGFYQDVGIQKISDESLTAVFEPVIYWTKDGTKREGRYEISGQNTLTVAIDEPSQSYPLVIDPTINFGDWIGGAGQGVDLQILALAVQTDEIYAGGYTTSFVNLFGAPEGGTYSGGQEGIVIEISDASPPTIQWVQWLGSDTNDQVTTLAVISNEIYAGGWTSRSTGWDTGNYTSGVGDASFEEGFMVEITDAQPPTISWRRWLGGTKDDRVLAMALNGGEIYAGGYSSTDAGWETVIEDENGTFQDGLDGFVVEFNDEAIGIMGAFDWRQWLGSKGDEKVMAMAITGEEIYAGGFSTGVSVSWTMLIAGTGNSKGTNQGGMEGWVVEIADLDPNVQFAWYNWMGCAGEDVVLALALNANEVYAGGFTTGNTALWTNFDTHSNGTYTGLEEGWVVEIGDGATPDPEWIQWLGGAGNDRVTALATNGNEIYAGGYSTTIGNWDTVVSVSSGTFPGDAGASEGWVVELDDVGSNTKPDLIWLQWLGADSNDQVLAMVITGEEIYAGGFSSLLTNWETAVSSIGTDTVGLSGFMTEIADGASPSMAWEVFMGGHVGDTTILSLAVTGDEIYAGGYAGAYLSLAVGTTTGVYSGGDEGFVVEIADGATPAVAWLAWFGSSSNDQVTSLAINGDEIFAGGWTSTSTAAFDINAGVSYNGAMNGWVVRVTDVAGAAPNLSLGNLSYLGGGGFDQVLGLAVNGTEVYAGGYSDGSSTWNTAGSTIGTYSGNYEGWVVEVHSNGAGTPFDLNWLSWLGGTGIDIVYAVAVTGTEIYAGGYVQTSAQMELSATRNGTFGANTYDGFVVEIADGSPPTLTWLQWLGTDAIDSLYALAVTGDEIYAGGYANSSTGFDTVSTIANTPQGGTNDGWVVEISDGAPTPTLSWLQWLSGSGTDVLYALAVNGNEIYAAGRSGTASDWGSGFRDGNLNVINATFEGWLVEIDDKDGFAPTVAWRQWLGGDSSDVMYAVAVNGDEIYVGGYTNDTASWEITLPDMGILTQVAPYIELQDRDRKIILIQ